MKATLKQIEKALDNSYEFGVDGSEELYQLARIYCDNAIDNVGLRKSRMYFTKSDWKAVYREIKRLILKTS